MAAWTVSDHGRVPNVALAEQSLKSALLRQDREELAPGRLFDLQPGIKKGKVEVEKSHLLQNLASKLTKMTFWEKIRR